MRLSRSIALAAVCLVAGVALGSTLGDSEPERIQLDRPTQDLPGSLNVGKVAPRVAVIDTGIALEAWSGGEIVECADHTAGLPDYANCRDGNGHGTHLAGIIAGEAGDWSGIVPNSTLQVHRVCDSNNLCSSRAIAQALRTLADDPPDVVLIGIAGREPTVEEEDAIRHLVRLRTVVVAPVGNTGESEGIGFPARMPDVIGVGAVDENHVVTNFSASMDETSSEHGFSELALVAPGINIASLSLSGDIELRNGTSQAAAIVAAGIARMVSTGLEPMESAQCLILTAEDLIDPIADGQTLPGFDRYSGHGLVSFSDECTSTH